MPEPPTPRELAVADGRVLLRACTLYKRHACAILERHHVCPKSWWAAAGKTIDTPIVAICPTDHMNVHAAIDGLLAGRDVSAIPPRCVALARQGLDIAARNGLTPAPTL
jgi:hypothetical protein